MAISSVKHLPKSITDHYIRHNVDAESITGVWNGRDENVPAANSGMYPIPLVETYQVEFDDETMDVWQWVFNPESRDHRYPRAWMKVESRIPMDSWSLRNS